VNCIGIAIRSAIFLILFTLAVKAKSANSSTEVVAVESGPEQPVFNLDVARKCTSFVGSQKEPVHDNSLPPPVLTPFRRRIVPGLGVWLPSSERIRVGTILTAAAFVLLGHAMCMDRSEPPMEVKFGAVADIIRLS
jgi:hypothetical protein